MLGLCQTKLRNRMSVQSLKALSIIRLQLRNKGDRSTNSTRTFAAPKTDIESISDLLGNSTNDDIVDERTMEQQFEDLDVTEELNNVEFDHTFDNFFDFDAYNDDNASAPLNNAPTTQKSTAENEVFKVEDILGE
jgi:hypothetical protein